MADCYSLKRKHTRHDAVGQSRRVVLLKTLSSPTSSVLVDDAEDCFKPFVFEGSVSLTGKVEDQRIVKILRDIGGSQSFVLADVLPFCTESACKTSTFVQGIKIGFRACSSSTSMAYL